MIKRIYSTLSTFSEVKLHRGLNILLADVTTTSTDKDTRNGLGKTTFIDIINFLLGGRCDKHSTFKLSMFINEFFMMDIELEGSLITVKRRGMDANTIYINCESDARLASLLKDGVLPLKLWNNYLGMVYFNLDDNIPLVYDNLSFRSIFPYFARKANDGGFLEPVRHYKNQKALDVQIALTYLLGLNTNLAIKQKELDAKNSEIKNLRKALNTDIYKDITTKGISLDSEITIMTEKASRMKLELENFQVHPEYEEIEKQASDYAKEISNLSDENYLDRQILLNLKESSLQSAGSSNLDIKSLYDEVEIKLPSAIVNSYEDARKFQHNLIGNRAKYLESERQRYEDMIAKRSKRVKELSEEQGKLMKILQAHGALDQFNKLQSRLGELMSKIDSYKRQRQIEKSVKMEQANLKISEQKLILEITESLNEHEKIKNKAILLVEEISESLYETAAQLNIGQSDNGKYAINMASRNQKSAGINSMLIYCFDMMLIQVSRYLNRKLDFLIHDSALFDSVDERQVARALLFGKEKSLSEGFQYIVTLNSDQLPGDVYDEVKDNILSRVLTDSDESGCLMGVYY